MPRLIVALVLICRTQKITGIAMDKKEAIFLNSVFFVIGFVVVFSIVGIVLQVIVSSVAHKLMGTLTTIGGAVIILFGALLILSSSRFVPVLSREYKIHVPRVGGGPISSFVFGVAFAIGWTPCVGPILGSIYALAVASPGISFLLLLAYSFGLGIPFLAAGAFISRFSAFTHKARGIMRYFNLISGAFLIVMGLLVITGYIGELSVFLVSGSGGAGYVSLGGPLNFIVAILAGALTFLSPCILPLVPAYLSYMGGTAAVGDNR